MSLSPGRGIQGEADLGEGLERGGL